MLSAITSTYHFHDFDHTYEWVTQFFYHDCSEIKVNLAMSQTGILGTFQSMIIINCHKIFFLIVIEKVNDPFSLFYI